MTATTDVLPHQQKLQDAFALTREQLIERVEATAADRTTAYGAFDVARQTYVANHRASTDTWATLGAAVYLNEKLTKAALLAENAVALAESSDAKAKAATSAVAAMAASIKAAALATDALLQDISGIAGVSQNADLNSEAQQAAERAKQEIAAVAGNLESFKASALRANIEASQTTANVALKSLRDSERQVKAVRDSARTHLENTTTELTAATTTRTTSLTEVLKKHAGFITARRARQALREALSTIDQYANCGLTVTTSTPVAVEGKKGASEPILPAVDLRCDLSPDAKRAADDTEGVCFFVVGREDVPGFSLATAVALAALPKTKPKEGEPEQKARLVTKHVGNDWGVFEAKNVTHDYRGEPFDSERSYAAFCLRVPKNGAPTSGDLSFTSVYFRPEYRLQFAAKPAVLAISEHEFCVGFSPVSAPRETNLRYKLLLIPGTKGWSLAEAENALGFTVISGATPPSITSPSHRQSLREFLHTANRPSSELEQFQKDRYVVLFSPVLGRDEETVDGFTLAHYVDANGDRLNPQNDYVVQVIAESDPGEPQSTPALSTISDPVPLTPAKSA